MPAPEITAVIPTYDRPRRLAQALRYLRRQSVDPEMLELIVIADAAEPDPEAVERLVQGSGVQGARFARAERKGASAARNLGWRSARSELILFLDDDVMAGRHLVRDHLDFHRRHPEPETGLLGRVRWSHLIRVTPFMRWLDRGIQFDYRSIDGSEAGWGRFYTANVSLKRSMLERTGGFDEERLPFGYEDLDLAYRLDQLGFRLEYHRSAVAAHRHPMDVGMWTKRVRRIAAAERRFCDLHPDVEPFFFRLFDQAAGQPPASGRPGRLAAVIPPWVPRIGPYVWFSAERRWKQRLAPHFLDAWERAATQPANSGPDLAERQSSGSPSDEV